MRSEETSNNITDRFGRRITYLRASVTDLCNMRCVYCAPKDMKFLPAAEILTLEEIARVVSVGASAGIKKVRLTGGEPLARPNITKLVKDIRAIEGIEDLSLTTNGMLLEEFAAPLKDAGLRRINVSLDTLDEEKFRNICVKGELARVLRGIDAAIDADMQPVKINVVVMRGANDSELRDFVRFSIEKGVTVRFIEFMPTKGNSGSGGRFVSREEIFSAIEDLLDGKPREGVGAPDPARYYRLKQNGGMVGIISPVSHGFCSNCNRMRLTPDGFLRGCLLSEQRVDVKALLRCGATDGEIAGAFRSAAGQKGEKGEFGNMATQMNRIGG